MSRIRTIIPYVGAGCLWGIGILYPVLWPLGVAGVWWYLSTLLQGQLTLKRLVGYSAITWTTKSLLVVSFFWTTFPFDWLGVESHVLQLSAIAFYWLTVSLSLGTGGVVVAVLIWLLRRYTPPLALLVLLPFVWVGSEIFGSWFFSLFTWAPGISSNIGYSFGYVGYLFGSNSLLLQLASVAGVYGLSWAVIAVVLGIEYCRRLFSLRAVVITSLVVVFLLQTFSVHTPAPSLGVKVVVIDSRFDPDLTATEAGRQLRSEELQQAITLANQQFDPDFIILPEDSRLTNAFASPSQLLAWYKFTDPSPAVLYDSGPAEESGNNHVRAHIYVPEEGQVYAADKQYLVPQGEFFPSFYSAILSAVGFGPLVESIKSTINYTPGPLLHLPPESTLPAVLFCFESVSPLGVQKVRYAHTPFILHPVSHGWFHDPQTLWNQQDSMLKVQAVWNNLPIISAGNMVSGAAYYPNGTVDSFDFSPSEPNKFWQITVVEL